MKYRHVVNVMRPGEANGEDARSRPPATFRKDVPCSIEPLTGREVERMNQMQAVASVKVTMYGDPNKQIQATDWLIDHFGKRLNIAEIRDESRGQLGKVELMCGEEVK
jgi:hypothetical protein